MNPGLASLLVDALVKMLLPSPKGDSLLDTQTKLQIINTLQIAFNITDIKEEVYQQILLKDPEYNLVKYLSAKKFEVIGST